MASNQTSGAINAADVDARLPRRFFVKRGDIQQAFGFTKAELAELISLGIFVAKYPLGKDRRRARFVRSQAVRVAGEWEVSPQSFSKVQPSSDDQQ